VRTIEPLQVTIEDDEYVTITSAAGISITLPRLWAMNLVMDLEQWLAGPPLLV
jgi:hypothetical protein